ncbi:hypothetical protein F750_2131 [Streptomyces sp. PAMC 26508]|nr:hypothetical protein F750_2131 [Streptomyces sp. PAMC 26508]
MTFLWVPHEYTVTGPFPARSSETRITSPTGGGTVGHG